MTENKHSIIIQPDPTEDAQVAGFKSEHRPASVRNKWPASFWNAWPTSSEYPKERAREEKTNTIDLFSGHQAQVMEASIDEIVKEQMNSASTVLLKLLSKKGQLPFDQVLVSLLESHMLRETNIKDICIALAKSGKVDNTWGSGNRKPRDQNLIRLK